jgi:hypothetical protein
VFQDEKTPAETEVLLPASPSRSETKTRLVVGSKPTLSADDIAELVEVFRILNGWYEEGRR